METNRGREWMVVGAMVCIVAPTWSVAQSGGSLKVFSPGETVIAADVNNNFSLLQAGSVRKILQEIGWMISCLTFRSPLLQSFKDLPI